MKSHSLCPMAAKQATSAEESQLPKSYLTYSKAAIGKPVLASACFLAANPCRSPTRERVLPAPVRGVVDMLISPAVKHNRPPPTTHAASALGRHARGRRP